MVMTDPRTKTADETCQAPPHERRQIHDRYCRLVLAICMDTTGCLADAEDLAQEVFLRVFRGLQGLRDRERLAGWLMGITRHVCADWTRKRSRDRRLYVVDGDAALDRSADDSPNPEQFRLQEALTQLPEDQRLVLHLFYLDEQSAESARQMMDLSKSSFYRLLEQARQSLGRLLQMDQEVLP
jgi:RNA polymerase sigma-70 factor, ECF subfamily